MRVGYLRYYTSKSPGIKLRTMFAVANQHGVDFFQFSPKDVDIANKTINGRFWDKEIKTYIRVKVPYPAIVDDQYNFRRKDPEIYEELKKHCYLIYQPIGRKKQVFEKIKSSVFARYLIDTHLFKDIDIGEYLKKNKQVIIKPDNSSRGNEIYKLSLDNKNYLLEYGSQKETISPKEFIEQYSEKFDSADYIVQQYVHSTTDNGNPFDVRLHLRRGKDGKWNFALIYLRIGSSKGIVSNVAKGGSTTDNLDEFFKRELKGDWQKVIDEINYIAKELPGVLQSYYKKMIDALAIDVAINRANDNELKFFELNTYPGVSKHFETSEPSIQFYKYLMELKAVGNI